MHYAHLVRDAEDTARAKLDAHAEAFGRLVGVDAAAAGNHREEKTPQERRFLEVERTGIEPVTFGLQNQRSESPSR